MEILNEESSDPASIDSDPSHSVSMNEDPSDQVSKEPVTIMNEQSDQVSINKIKKDPVTIMNEQSDQVSINKDSSLPVSIKKDTVTIMNENEQSDQVSINKHPALPVSINKYPVTIVNEQSDQDPSVQESDPEPFDQVMPDSSEPIDNSESPSDRAIPMSGSSDEEVYWDDDDCGTPPIDNSKSPGDHVSPLSDSSDKEVYWDDDDYGIPPIDNSESPSDHVNDASEVYYWDDDDDDEYVGPPPLSSKEKEVWTVDQLELIRDRLSYTDTVRILAYKAARYVGDTYAVDHLTGICAENMINFEVVKYPGQPSTATPIPPAVVVFGHGGICPVSPSGGSKLFDDQEESDSDHVIAMSDTSDGHGKEVYQCDDHDYGTLPPLSSEDKEICTEQELEMIMDRLSYSDTVTIVANKAAVGDTHAVERLKRLCVDNLIDFEVVEYAGQPSTATPRPPVVFGAGSSCPPSLSSPPAASPSGGSKLSINKDPPIPVSIKDLSNPVTIMNDQSDNVIAKSGSSEPSTATPRTPAVVVFGAGAICPPSPQAASPSGGSG